MDLVGKELIDFKLPYVSEKGIQHVVLSQVAQQSNILLLFFPAAWTGVGTKELTEFWNIGNDFGEETYYVIHAADAGAPFKHGGEPIIYWKFRRLQQIFQGTTPFPPNPTTPTSPWPPSTSTRPPGQPPNTSCFKGDTQISMSNGTTKSIRDIKGGDIVKVLNTDSGEIETSKVVRFTCHYDTNEYMCINNELYVTPNHEFWTGSNWTQAKDLLVNDDIQYVNGTYKNIDSIKRVFEKTPSYNFCVESKYHNYFANGYCAHNKTLIYNPPTNRPPTVTPPKPPPPTTGRPTTPNPCTPVGSPAQSSLMVSCTACGTNISSTPTYAGISNSSQQPVVESKCSHSAAGTLYNSAAFTNFSPLTGNPRYWELNMMSDTVRATAFIPVSGVLGTTNKHGAHVNLTNGWSIFQIYFYIVPP